MSKTKLFALRALGLPLVYALLTGILPLIGNWDNPPAFFRAWADDAFNLGLVVFLVIYACALSSASAGSPIYPARSGASDPFPAESKIGVNGLPLNRGLDPFGNPMGISSSIDEDKYK